MSFLIVMQYTDEQIEKMSQLKEILLDFDIYTIVEVSIKPSSYFVVSDISSSLW